MFMNGGNGKMEKNSRLDLMLLNSSFYGIIFIIIFGCGMFQDEVALLKISLVVYLIMMLNMLMTVFFIDMYKKKPNIVIIISFILLTPLLTLLWVKNFMIRLLIGKGGDDEDEY